VPLHVAIAALTLRQHMQNALETKTNSIQGNETGSNIKYIFVHSRELFGKLCRA
jgi:hypothetical protein